MHFVWELSKKGFLFSFYFKLLSPIVSTYCETLLLYFFSQSKNSGTLARGGNQQPFHTQINLYKNSLNGFTKILEPSGIVHLGEDLLLRAHVKSGDGWNNSRIADVTLQRLGQFGHVINSATLITSNGCVNPSMISICPQPPKFEPPLAYSFRFKAIMFQEMKSGDEMAISVRMVGCIDYNDCLLVCYLKKIWILK